MTPPFPFTGVLFDCDGVLVDSEPITNGVLREMLHELGWPISEEECVRRFVGRALKDEWAVIEANTGIRPDDAWYAEFRRRRNEALLRGLVPIPGAFEAVERIGALVGGRIACATGADRAKVEMQLRATGFDRLFGDRVFSGMELPRTKPAPDVYLAAAEALGIDPSTAAVIEDSVAGVTAGVSAGAVVFGYAPDAPTHTSSRTLIEAGAAVAFTDMRELPALLQGWGAGARR